MPSFMLLVDSQNWCQAQEIVILYVGNPRHWTEKCITFEGKCFPSTAPL